MDIISIHGYIMAGLIFHMLPKLIFAKSNPALMFSNQALILLDGGTSLNEFIPLAWVPPISGTIKRYFSTIGANRYPCIPSK